MNRTVLSSLCGIACPSLWSISEWVLTNVWWGLCLHHRIGSNGWTLQWCSDWVLGEQWDVLPAPLPHCQQKTWLHELTCVTSLNTWEISVTSTLKSVSALIHTTRFHWSHDLTVWVGMAEQDLHTICLQKSHSESNNKLCQALCMIYDPGFLQETPLT